MGKGTVRGRPTTTQPTREDEFIQQLQGKIERTTSRITLGRFVGEPFTARNILAHELQTLLPRRWLDEGALHLYFILLTRHYSQYGYIPSSCVPLFRGQVTSESLLSEQDVNQVFGQLIHGDIDSILVPLRLLDVWILCVISGDGNIYIYDSTASQGTHLKPLKHLLSWVAHQVDEVEWQLCTMSENACLIDQCNHAVMVAVFAELYCQGDGEDPQQVAHTAHDVDPARYRPLML